MRAYVFVGVEPSKAEEVAGKVAQVGGVKAAHLCWGEPDVIAQVEAENEADLKKLVVEGIQPIGGVRKTDTHLALEK